MLPTLISIGPLVLSSFGVFMAIAFVNFSYVTWKNLHDLGTEDEKIFDHLAVVMVASLLGARLWFVIAHWATFAQNPLAAFLIWQYPGLSFWGGILIGALALFIYAKQVRLSPLIVFEAYAYGFPWGFLFASLAIFLDGTIIGRPTTLPIGLPAVGEVGLHHPVGAYAFILAVIALVGLAILNWRVPRRQLPPGLVTFSMLAFIGFSQFLLAFFRQDLLYFKGISVEMVLGLGVFIIGVGLVFWRVQGLVHIKKLLSHVIQKLTKRS